jgi:protein-S-isoprenylcysteine O-methyltransferase Ste14
VHDLADFGSALISTLWLSWVAYWILAAARTKANRRTESWLSGALYRVPLVLGIILLVLPRQHRSLANLYLWPRSVITLIIGICLITAGLGVAVWARRHLGAYWSAHITLKVNHRVVQSGPYAFVRHPIYSGLLLAFVGTVISIGTLQSCVGLALMFLSFLVKLRLEEQWLSTHLGAEYKEYRHRVKALIPHIL